MHLLTARRLCRYGVAGRSEQAKALAPTLGVKRTPIRDYLAERSRNRRARAGWLEQFRLLIGRQWRQTSR